jgi:hypothetical protein
MSYGLKILNSGNFVQIDDTYENTVLVASGSASASTANNWDNPVRVNFTAVTGTPLLCIKFNSSSAYCCVTDITSSYFEFALLSETNLLNGVSGTIQWRIYAKKPTSISVSGYGLVVRNSAGNPVFSSNETYPRIAAVLNCCPFVSNASNKAVSTIYYGVSLSAPFLTVPGTLLSYLNSNDGMLEFNYFCFRTNGSGVVQTAAFSNVTPNLSYFALDTTRSFYYLPQGVLYS